MKDVFEIYKEDLIFYAFYLTRTRKPDQELYITKQQMNAYIASVENNLKANGITYKLLDGKNMPDYKKCSPEAIASLEKTKFQILNNAYNMNANISINDLRTRIFLSTKMVLRSYFEPKGYRDILGIENLDINSKQSQPGE